MSDEYQVYDKYEITREVKDAVARGEDFLYMVGTREQFTELYQSINFIRQETQKDVIVAGEHEVTPLIKTVVLRWNVKDEQNNHPHIGS